MSGFARKVKRQNIVKETGEEKRSKEQVASDLRLAEEGLTSSIEGLKKTLTETDTEKLLAGVASGDRAMAEYSAGAGGYGAATNIGTSAQLASNAVASMTGVKDESTKLQTGRLGALGELLSREAQISSKAGVASAKQEASQDITKFLSGEQEKSARRGAIEGTLSSFVSGALRQGGQNIADTGSFTQKGPYTVAAGETKLAGDGTLLQGGDYYTVGILGNINPYTNVRAPKVPQVPQVAQMTEGTVTGQTTKKQIDPYSIGNLS